MGDVRYKVLLVEDNELDQMAFKRSVEQGSLPYDCTIAGSVAEAQDVLARERFDIVISDYSLGDGTAFDVLESVEDTPVILVTGAGDEEIAIKAWRAGACDYLIKDVNRNYLRTLPITAENVVKLKKTEEQLRLLSGAVMSTDDSVYITDMENKIIFVNKAFCETYGYATEEIMGQDGEILWAGREQAKDGTSVSERRAAESGRGVGFYHQRQNGGVFPVLLSRSAIEDADGNEVALVAVARDISEQTLIEEELRTANLELERQHQRKNEMLVAVAESLKSILAIGDRGRAESVLEDLVTVCRTDVGKMELERSEFDFAALVREVVETFSPPAADRGIEVGSSVPDYEIRVNGDRGRIVHVLRNLLKRAACSVGRGGHVDIRVEGSGNQIVVEVGDDGPAVGSKEMQNVFDGSGWASEQGWEKYGDLALGLPAARELVELHGGCLWAESGSDRGNTVCFTLPKSGVYQEVSTAMSGRDTGRFSGGSQ